MTTILPLGDGSGIPKKPSVLLGAVTGPGDAISHLPPLKFSASMASSDFLKVISSLSNNPYYESHSYIPWIALDIILRTETGELESLLKTIPENECSKRVLEDISSREELLPMRLAINEKNSTRAFDEYGWAVGRYLNENYVEEEVSSLYMALLKDMGEIVVDLRKKNIVSTTNENTRNREVDLFNIRDAACGCDFICFSIGGQNTENDKLFIDHDMTFKVFDISGLEVFKDHEQGCCLSGLHHVPENPLFIFDKKDSLQYEWKELGRLGNCI